MHQLLWITQKGCGPTLYLCNEDACWCRKLYPNLILGLVASSNKQEREINARVLRENRYICAITFKTNLL